MSVYGYVDGINGKVVSGWLVDQADPATHCDVVAYCDGHAVAEAKADRYREDLRVNGIGDGRHAFEISLPDRVIGQGPVQIVEKKTGFVLTPISDRMIGQGPVQIVEKQADDTLTGSSVNPTRREKSRVVEEIDSILTDFFEDPSAQIARDLSWQSSMEGRHYDRISKMISDKPAAEVLTLELAHLAERMDAQDRELRQIRSLLALQSVILRAPEQAQITLPERADLRADTFISDVRGFFGLEWSRDGDPFRWTGPERAALLDVYVARAQPVTLNLVLLKMRPDGQDDQCRILVDGLPVRMQVQITGGYALYRTTLPASVRAQKTQVCIISPELFSSGADNSTLADTRRLGIAFHRLVAYATSSNRARSDEEAQNA
ncbi:hypothetical protein GGE65_000766 [Skermanella aerolata]|uniref:hypothetical protein n=1 Tax=Skermanella aerolata TaxID=393310 RepID=UPI003D22AA8F